MVSFFRKTTTEKNIGIRTTFIKKEHFLLMGKPSYVIMKLLYRRKEKRAVNGIRTLK